MKNEQTTYQATYHNNYPTCNGQQVFDKEGEVTLTRPAQEGDARDFNITYKITGWHSFDDFGVEVETVKLQNVLPFCNEVEAYSYDGGETFTFDCE
jgi:hypothetical protein